MNLLAPPMKPGGCVVDQPDCKQMLPRQVRERRANPPCCYMKCKATDFALTGSTSKMDCQLAETKSPQNYPNRVLQRDDHSQCALCRDSRPFRRLDASRSRRRIPLTRFGVAKKATPNALIAAQFRRRYKTYFYHFTTTGWTNAVQPQIFLSDFRQSFVLRSR